MTATIAERLDRLDAAAQIRQLAVRYAAALDARDLDALVSLFVDDVPVGRGRRGRDALREVFFDAPLRRLGVTILHVGTHVVELDGPDDAHGSVYCRAEMQTGPDTWIAQDIHYGDTYARRDGRWFFVTRDHQLFHGVEFGRRPVGLAPAEWPRRDTGAGTLPAAWPSWQRFWDRS